MTSELDRHQPTEYLRILAMMEFGFPKFMVAVAKDGLNDAASKEKFSSITARTVHP
jgi:hypothetical protein